jgi:hypothetical protein
VRQRLRRIEKHTGRSLARPRDVAELCIALEVHHTLIQPKRASSPPNSNALRLLPTVRG